MSKMNPKEYSTELLAVDKHGKMRELKAEYTYNWETRDLMFVRLSEDGKPVELGMFRPDAKAAIMHNLHQHAAIHNDPNFLNAIIPNWNTSAVELLEKQKKR